MFGFLKRPKVREFYYPRCPECGAIRWVARGNGEMVERYGNTNVYQYHQCMNCGLRIRLCRRLRRSSWTVRAMDLPFLP